MAQREGFSKPNLNSGFKTPIKLKDGNNVFRLLPPVSRFSPDGSWFRYHKQHFGYGIKDATGKFLARPFTCIQDIDFKTKKVNVECPECDLIARWNADLEVAKVKAQSLIDPDDRRALLSPFADFRKSHNIDKKYYLNVLAGTGEISYTRLPYKAFNLLRTKVKELKERGTDPFDVDAGVWFNVKRSGEKLDTEYALELLTEPVLLPTGQQAYVTKSAQMTEDQINEALEGAVDLREMTTTIKAADIQRLVDSNGAQEVVEAIFGQANAQSSTATDDDVDALLDAAAPQAPTPPAGFKNSPAGLVPVAVGSNQQPDAEATLLAQLAAVRAARATTTVKPATTPAPVKDQDADLDDLFR